MQKILGSHWKSSPKDWLLSLCLRPAADHGPYVAWQTQLISEHADRTETLSHAPVKAWPTNTPGGILICYNLLVLVSKSFKRVGGWLWRMERGKDEFSWSSPKRTLPWPEGTNRMDCPCPTSPGVSPALLLAQDPISTQLTPTRRLTSRPGLNPVPREVPDALGQGCPRLLPSCPGPCWGDGTGSSWQDPALPPPRSPDTICV